MNDNPIKYSDLVSPDDSIDKLIKALDELNDSYMNFCNNVKQNAVSLKASLQGVSGATEEGRKTIRAAASDTDKLTKAIQERNFAESETAKRLAEIKAATHEASTLNKLQAKLANSAAGSYDALSAQYSMNKMILNQMSAEERKATKEGQELEKETKAIYEEMKRLQEATGKHSLNVGNYAEATTGLRSQIMQLTEELVRMRMEGKQNTAEYANLQQKAATLKDAFKDATAEVQNLASDTSALDSVLSGLGAATGGFAAATGAMRLFGDESEDVQQAQRKLQAAIALVNGVTAIQKNLQHQSALMLGISKIQTSALAKAEAYERLVKIKGNEATWGAVVAQKAFNLVAKANPYVLLATALVSVVGALVAFSRGSKEAKVSTVEQEKAITNLNIALDAYNEKMDYAIKKAQAEGKSTKDINALRRQQAAVAVEVAEATKTQYAEQYNAYLKILEDEGKLNKKQEEQFKEVAQKYLEASEAVTKAKADERKVTQDIAIQEINDGKQTQDNLTAMLRKAQDQRNALIKDDYDRERAQRKTATKNAIDDIKKQLKEDTNLTLEEKAALNEQIKLYRQQLNADLKAIDDKQRKDIEAANLAAIRAAQDVELSLMEEGAEKRLRQLEIEHQREIEDIDRRLQNEKDLTQEQMTALFAMRLNLENKYNSDVERLKNEAALEAFDRQQEFEASEFDLLNKSEAKKKQFRLQQEKARLQKVLELGMMNGKALSDIEVATIKNTIERINGEISQSQVPQDIYDVFGLDLSDDKKAAIDTSMQYAMAALNQWMDMRVQAAEKAVEAANKEVDAAQRAYELELEAKANGYAADVENSKKELDLAKQNQKKALEQQQQAQAQQEKLQTIQQITSLITGAAQIWGAFGATPYVAIPLIALMFASFAASKIMARNAAQEQQYAEGTVELLQGGSHASGRDIALGAKPDGTRRRAEGGEFFAVINKRNSRRFRKEIPQVIHALNDGTFADKYLNTFNMDGFTLGSNGAPLNLGTLTDDVQAIRQQGAKRYVVLADGTMVEIYKNLTRRVQS